MVKTTVVIIGGGIAGTTCAEYILDNSTENVNVIIIASKDVVKTAVTEKRTTENLTEVGLKEKTKDSYEIENSSIQILVGCVTKVDANECFVQFGGEEKVNFNFLCICTGAKPVPVVEEPNPYVICIRDTDTVNDLKKRLVSAKKVIVIGNGGIALEFVYEVANCEVVWCIKDDSIGNRFFDEGAAAFMIHSLGKSKTQKIDQTIFKRKRFGAEKTTLVENETSSQGVALGPDWSSSQELKGCNENLEGKNILVKYSCTVDKVWRGKRDDSASSNVYVRLSNGDVIGGDFIVSATGAVPNLPFPVTSTTPLELSDDGGIKVNDQMQSNLPNIYAAGDVCTPSWELSENWFPMKLWTQAWQMGAYAGKCVSSNMNDQHQMMDICFDYFSHITTFFGYKICFLGCFNGQNFNKSDYEAWIRYTPDEEYIKVIAVNGRVKGCLLIGETDLEETFENLILNELDISFLGPSILDPGVDIEDYFD